MIPAPLQVVEVLINERFGPQQPKGHDAYNDVLWRLREKWLEFVAELDFEGFFERLDHYDGCSVAAIVFNDLSRNADGSHFLRWRAEELRGGAPIAEDSELHDRAAVIEVLEAIAKLVGTRPRTQT